MSYKDFSKMIKNVLKDEMELIETSKISYNDFNRYKILKSSIEGFGIFGNLSQSKQIEIINKFIHNLKENFKKIIENNNLLDKNNNLDFPYFSFIKKISLIRELVSNEEIIDKEKLQNFKNEIYQDIEKVDKFLNDETKEKIRLIFDLIENDINENENFKNKM